MREQWKGLRKVAQEQSNKYLMPTMEQLKHHEQVKPGGTLFWALSILVLFILLFILFKYIGHEWLTAIGTIGVILYALYKDLILAWWRRPVFSLHAGTSRPLLTNAYISNTCKGFCYHLLLRNTGKSTAKNCEAELSEIWTAHHEYKDKFRERLNYIPTQLQWALNGRTTDIHMGGKKYIDLGYIVDRRQDKGVLGFDNIESLRIYFANMNMPFGVIRELESGQKHRIMITILGDNFKPLTKQWFEIFIPLSCHDPSSDFKKVSTESYVINSEKPSGSCVFKED